MGKRGPRQLKRSEHTHWYRFALPINAASPIERALLARLRELARQRRLGTTLVAALLTGDTVRVDAGGGTRAHVDFDSF